MGLLTSWLSSVDIIPPYAIIAMRSRIHAVVLPSEIGDFADEVRRVFLELGRTFGPSRSPASARPPLDVYETDERSRSRSTCRASTSAPSA